MTRGAVDARDARIIGEWITGRHASFRRAVFCAPGAPVEPAAAAVTGDDVLLVPSDTAIESAAHVVRFDGAFDEVGDVLHVAGHAVELQHYAAAAYVELVGPTAMRFLDADGWRAFLADADLARAAGVFTSPMTDPRLRLADADVFDDPFASTAPRALHVHADGHLTAGAQGAVLGLADDLAGVLASQCSRWEALAGIVAPADLTRDLSARPWLGRFVHAAELAGVLRLEASDSRIDGFGWSAAPDEGQDGGGVARADGPFLVRTPDGVLLVDLRTRRRQRLPEQTVRVVATLQASADATAAADRLARTERLSAEAARALCAEAERLLGVRPGVPAAADSVAVGAGA
ncbi:daptide biosynthesis RiPP recognition protein [Microbacterium sp. B19]|uniref:daptide biosynthesis RiPP recognition protein n=1 Tax=Microbacterium sp. B19 TaxID=96765 RepID=UPI0011D1E8B3|nr:daptide biosynthesis RiPP recognition protein [Microbacterium sp. B19]